MSTDTPDSSATRPARIRLDALLLEHGLAPSRERAQAMILAGQVLVDGRPQSKPGMRVAANAAIALAEIPAEARYVSRGGLKLERALDAFHLDPTGRVALDVGASTGGFTDVLLQRGAAMVFAIDVGQGQLAWRLREDARVVVLERTNVRSLERLPGAMLGECAAIDVSFISLRLVLPHVVRLTKPGAWFVALVKPQFEAGRHEADRGNGVIRDPAVRRQVLRDLLAWCGDPAHHLRAHGIVASPIQGRDGNHEYLLWLTHALADEPPAPPLEFAAIIDNE